MKSVPITAVKAQFAKYLRASAKQPIILTRAGKPVALLDGTMDPDDLERMQLANNPRFRAFLARARKQIETEGGIPHDEFWRSIEREYPEVFSGKSDNQKRRRAKRPTNGYREKPRAK